MHSAPIPFMPRTKLRPPRLPDDLLPRPRLWEKLSRTETLMLVIAPAGYGKTTLVGTWVARCDRPYAWISLDREDNTFAGFLAALTLAMRRVAPTFGDALLELLGAETGDHLAPESVMPILLNALNTVERDYVLVLDDYHCICEPAVHHVLWTLLTHPPRNMHLVLTARYDPPIPARLRLQGTVSEIRAGDLRFGAAEIQDFLAQFAEQPLDAQSVAAFSEQAEGWAVPMRLMAAVMHQRRLASIEGALRGCSGYLLEYLEAEVIGGLSPDIQTFLMQTSILKRLSTELCDSVIGSSLPGFDSAATLQMLADNGIFVESLDEDGEWFRYHELFRILLQHRLRRTVSEQAVMLLEKRVGAWCELHGQPPTGERRTLMTVNHADKQPSPLASSMQAAMQLPAARSAQAPVPNRCDLLTFREMDVMELLNERLSNKEIARQLGISYETVRQHTVNIYRKLGVGNRRQAVVQANTWGLMADTQAVTRLPAPK